MFKILITGGHLTPALAFIDYCQNQKLPVTIIFAGREYAQLSTKQPSWEKVEIDQRHLQFIAFEAVKTGSFNLLQFWRSYQQAKNIISTQEIDLVLSFGGFLAVPFALAATSNNIPVITHEQTRVFGRANRFIAPLARQIAISFPHTRTFFPSKTTLTGNPLRPQLFVSAPVPSWFHSDKSQRPWLYLAGGSQGSQTLTQNFLPILPQILSEFVIIHQLGRSSASFQPLETVNQYLTDHQLDTSNYYPREFLSAAELAYFYPRLDLAISRAGANTIAELSAFAIPTLFVPLPFSNFDEQVKNAQGLVDQRAALMLPQANLLPATLLAHLTLLQQQQVDLKYRLSQLPVDQTASQKLWQLIQATLSDSVQK